MRDLLLKRLLKSKANEAKSADELIDEYLEEVKQSVIKDTKEFISSLISYLMQHLEEIDKEELLKIINKKIEQFGIKFSLDELDEIYNKNATAAAAAVGIKFSFDKVDTKLIESLYNSFIWLKQSADEKIQKKLKDTIAKALEGDIKIDKLGEVLKEEIGDLVEGSANYFQASADHIIKQTNILSHIKSMKEAGFEYYKIHAKIDNKTSAICRSMHGRVISVEDGFNQALEIATAKDIEAKKAASPWQSSPLFGKLPKNALLPPFHFRCRTTIVAFDEAQSVVDGKKTKGSYLPGAIYLDKQEVVFSHIDGFGYERVLTNVGKKHQEASGHYFKPKELIAGLNSLDKIALSKKEDGRVLAYSSNKNIVFVFEGQKIVTAFRPDRKDYFKDNVDTNSIYSKSVKKGANSEEV